MAMGVRIYMVLNTRKFLGEEKVATITNCTCKMGM